MKKRLVAFILLCCTGFSLMACSNKHTTVASYVKNKQKTGNKKKSYDKGLSNLKYNSKPEKGSWTLDEIDIASSHRFNSAEDFWISYKGIKYQLPTSISLFQDWSSNEINEIVRPGQHLIGASLKREGYESVSIVPYNDTTEDLKVADCKIAGLTIRQPLSSAKTIEVSLPCGITLGSTYDDVIKAYGEATVNIASINYPNSKIITYRVDLYTYVRIGFSNNLVTFFDIRNMS